MSVKLCGGVGSLNSLQKGSEAPALGAEVASSAREELSLFLRVAWISNYSSVHSGSYCSSHAHQRA